MNGQDVIDMFMSSHMPTPSVSRLLVTLFMSFSLAFVVATVYRITQRNNNFTVAFLHSLFLFSALVAVVTLVVGSNLARAFGLFGALSVVRFRNALKSPADALFIFWAMVIGLTCGTGFFLGAVVITGVCAAFLLLLHYSGYGLSKSTDSILKVTLSNTLEVAPPSIDEWLKGKVRTAKKLNEVTDSRNQELSVLYMLKLRKNESGVELANKLSKVSGVLRAQYLSSDPISVQAF